MFRSALLASLGLLLAASPALARTWYITPDGTGDAPTIAAALDSASSGDTVLLSPGTYLENSLHMPSGLTLRGNAASPEGVVIDAQKKGRVIWCDGDFVLEGLTLRNGLAGQRGAGAYCAGPGLVSQCRFESNETSGTGAGLYAYCAAVEIEDCVFVENTAVSGGGISIMAYLCTGPPSIRNCVFTRNSATEGGAIYTWNGSPSIEGTLFLGNSADVGGALAIRGAAWLPIIGCTFVRNSAETGGAVAIVGGNTYTSAIIENTIIAFQKGGVPVTIADPIGSYIVRCSDVFGNVGGDWAGPIEDFEVLFGNFSADPLFCDPDGGDFTIRSNSPCAPPGATGCGLIGALDVGCGPVSVEAESWGTIKALYRLRSGSH